MKRLILIVLITLCLTGCVNIKSSDYSTIVNEAVNSNVKIYNTYRSGYKFYLPSGLYITRSKEYNEVIKSADETYYLYIDLVSYLNKISDNYKPSSGGYYSYNINTPKSNGYLEINQKNDKYLVEIVYNYAKIEVMVDEKNIKDAISNGIVILSSIYYNDNILKNLSDDEILSYKEKTVDIFNNNSGRDKSNFLEYVEEYDDATDDVPDTDKIK